MDIGMPFMDGKKAAKEIRSIYNLNSPKIIAYTANNEQKMINDTENKELFDDIIIKPAIRDIFKKTILRNLNIQNKDNT
jgi:CheY-like chemotaxis protein